MPGSVFGGFGWLVNAATTQPHAFRSPQYGASLPSGSSVQVNPFDPSRSVVTFPSFSIRATAALAPIRRGAPASAFLMNAASEVFPGPPAWARATAGTAARQAASARSRPSFIGVISGGWAARICRRAAPAASGRWPVRPPVSLFAVRRAALAPAGRPPARLLPAPRLRRGGGPRGAPDLGRDQRGRDQPAEPLGDLLAVPELAPRRAGDEPQPPGRVEPVREPGEQAAPLLRPERGGAREVPDQLHPGRRAVHVLPARPAGPGGAIDQLRGRDADAGRDVEWVVSHQPSAISYQPSAMSVGRSDSPASADEPHPHPQT